MFSAGISAKAEQAEPGRITSPGEACMARTGDTASGTKWPRQDPSRVQAGVAQAAPTRAGASGVEPLGCRAGEPSCPSFPHTSGPGGALTEGPSGFQGRHAGSPVELGEYADLSLYKVSDRLGFLP